MRIISGYASGRRLFSPGNDSIRPTTDRVREALFSILGDVRGVVVVDGFAGSGALGCEALSRGAASCYFFDRDRGAVELVKKNVEVIDAQARATIKKCPFARGLTLLREDPDLIFLDPPYGEERVVQRAFDVMSDNARITAGALVVLEQDEDDRLPEVRNFALEDERLYGRTRVTFWRRDED